MKSRRTFLKLFLENLLFMVLIIVLAGAFTYHRLDANYQAESRRNQDRLVGLTTEHFQSLWPLTPQRVDDMSKRLLQDPAMRLTVVAADGKVLGESDADPAAMADHKTPDRPEIMAALAGSRGSDERFSETRGVMFRYVALPLVHDGKVVAAVRVATPVKAIAEGESFIRDTVLWAALAGTIAAVGLSLVTTWIWYSPLRRISQTARRIASGDLSSRPGAHESERLGDLASALNEMRGNLGKYLAQIASQHQDLQTVMANLQEGVIAADSGGHVVLINHAAAVMLGADAKSSIGQPVQHVIQTLDVLVFHEEVLRASGDLQGQFDITSPAGKRRLEVHGVRVPPGPSTIATLLVVRDVTELSAAAAMKANFVANASHELRTPLATIRAAVDSLGAMEPGDHQEFTKLANMLDRHVARLEDMTKDLLDLHMVESAKLPLRLQEMGLGELAEWVRQQFAALAHEKGLTLQATATPPQHMISTDRKLVELILRNLVDNAIKFTPPGGRVECSFTACDKGAAIRVTDTGCGIKSADQARVFERFFQSDSARSGDTRTRGTGLGLAIVKHIVNRHRGALTIDSVMGQGSVFAVYLPMAEDEAAAGEAA